MQIGSMEFSPARIGLAITTLLTAVIHFALGGALFMLNGVGYLALWSALFLPIPIFMQWRRQIRWIFAGYTLLTIVLYFVAHPNGAWQEDALGIVTKFIEVLLLLLIIYDGQETRPVEG